MVAFAIIESLPGAMERVGSTTVETLGSDVGRDRLYDDPVRQGSIMAVAEDRRRISDHGSSCCRSASWSCLPRWRSASGSCRSSSTPSTRRWRRTTTSGRSRCARRVACCSIATARCSSRIAIPSPFRSSASTPRTSSARSGCCPQVAGLDRERGRADRRSASRRAELSADRRRRGRDAGAGGGDYRAASRLRAAGRRRRRSADAPVPDRSAGRAPVRVRG